MSGVQSLMDYDVSFAGAIDGRARRHRDAWSVPVTSLCPCSKEISDYGAHNQRSHVTVAVRPRAAFVVDRGLVRVGEEQASCELYGLLKRPDEKYVTERAYDNPQFVEDMVRDIAARLDGDPRIDGLRVERRELRVDPQPLRVRGDRRAGRSDPAADSAAFLPVATDRRRSRERPVCSTSRAARRSNASRGLCTRRWRSVTSA